MALHHPPTYVLTAAARLSPAECQSHVDARTFLIPLRLMSLDPDGGGQAGADLGGRKLGFTVVRRRPADLPGTDASTARARWPFAYAFRGLGQLDTSLAANMVALAVAAATEGALYNESRGILQDFAAIQASIDGVLAVEFGRPDLFEARFPDLAKQPSDGPYDTIVTRIWKGDRLIGENVRRLRDRS